MDVVESFSAVSDTTMSTNDENLVLVFNEGSCVIGSWSWSTDLRFSVLWLRFERFLVIWLGPSVLLSYQRLAKTLKIFEFLFQD
jgi:hypothetical protein